MESLAKLHSRHQPLNLSLNQYRPSFPKPFSSLSFKTPSSSPFKFASLRASSSSNHQNPKPSPSSSSLLLQTLNNPIIKSTFIAITAAAALFFMRLHHTRPALAAFPVASSTSTVQPDSKTDSTGNENISLEELERLVEERLTRDPEDVESLRSLMEVKIKLRKLPEAIQVIDRLIEVEPEEKEWPLLKAQIYSYSGEFEEAKRGFEEILSKDPLRVEAYHGLVMAYSESGDALKDVEKRVQFAMEKCRKEKKQSDIRDFKLLLAQIRVMEGKHMEALKVYDELVKEEPRDFRPYLCQGIIYTLLKKRDEAEKYFDKFRRLVPKNHPYREYLFDNMVATKLFSEKAERERAN